MKKLKSDQDGIERCFVSWVVYLSCFMRLKSDQDGIEIGGKRGRGGGRERLKSDQDEIIKRGRNRRGL